MEFGVLRASSAEQRNQWTGAWERLPKTRRDVYFLPEYVLAFEADGRGEALCAVAFAEEAVWLYPFLKCPIEPLEDPKSGFFFDVQTAYGYGGPAVNEAGEDADFLGEAWRRFAAWCVEASVVGEFCRFHPLLDNYRWAASEMTVREERKTVVVDLETYPDAVREQPCFRQQRKMLRRAEREGYAYDVLPGVTEEQTSWFLPMYARAQDRLQARDETRFGKSYFDTLAETMGDKAWFGVVRKSEADVAAILVIEGMKFAHTHLMGYGGDGSANGMSNYLYHGIALEAARRGLSALHVGGGNSNDEDDSLFRFKSNLSPERRSFHIGTCCHNQELYEKLGARWERRNGPRPDGYFLFYRT